MWTLFHPLTQGSMLGTFFFLLYISNSSGTVETFYMTFNINVTIPALPTDGIFCKSNAIICQHAWSALLKD